MENPPALGKGLFELYRNVNVFNHKLIARYSVIDNESEFSLIEPWENVEKVFVNMSS